MKITRVFQFDDYSRNEVTYLEPDKCPSCKYAIKPEELKVLPYSDQDGKPLLAAMYLCKHCYRPFVAMYSFSFDEHGEINSNLVYVAPDNYTEEHFNHDIENLSPQFVKIYNQSLEAESKNLDEIAGIGYRKALEFLVKDYCIHANPEAEQEIKILPLSKCIEKYIGSSSIKTLASRAAWIGNDEAHYIRKQEDRDVDDMKRFIQAAVHFVGMELIVEDAESIAHA